MTQPKPPKRLKTRTFKPGDFVEIKKVLKIAFDVDDTLIIPSVATGFDMDTPNYETIAIFRWFQAQGNHMIIWSGSGSATIFARAINNGLKPLVSQAAMAGKLKDALVKISEGKVHNVNDDEMEEDFGECYNEGCEEGQCYQRAAKRALAEYDTALNGNGS